MPSFFVRRTPRPRARHPRRRTSSPLTLRPTGCPGAIVRRIVGSPWVLALGILGAAGVPGAPLTPLAAQSVDLAEIRVGESVEGTLSSSSPRTRGGGAFQAWRFEARSGDRFVADARSADFDAYLVLAHAVGGITETVREDDDGGEGTDARIHFTVDRDGTYVLVVRGLRENAAGRFTLSLALRDPAPPAIARPIAPGTPVRGELSPDGSVFPSPWGGEEIPFDYWTLEGEAGRGVRISMESDDFDAYLELGRLDGEDFIVEASDDDGGEHTNALLRHEYTHTGTYTIRARALGEQVGDGRYTLRVEPWTPAPPLRRPITTGAPVSGEFTRDDAILPQGPYVQEWALDGEAGDRLRIRMRSNELDSYLSFGQELEDGSFREYASNDDAPDDGLHSLIEFVLPEGGTWIIRARPLGSGVIGAYTLSVEVARE